MIATTPRILWHATVVKTTRRVKAMKGMRRMQGIAVEVV
jgi:hypothetical protein